MGVSEGDQSWNIIRLKKDILKEFPQLKEKRGSFGYVMIISKSREEVKKVLSETNKETIPILLFFQRDIKQKNSD